MLGAVAGAQAHAAPASSAALDPGLVFDGRCYPGTSAYPFPHARGLYGRTPYCRRTVAGPALNRAQDTLGTTPGGGNMRAVALDVLRGDDGSRTWAVKDSFGVPFAYMRETRRNSWTVLRAEGADGRTAGEPVDTTDPSDGPRRRNPPVRLQVQGRGCMASTALERTHAIVALMSGRGTIRGQNRGLGGAYIGLRGFVERRALPPRFRYDKNGKRLPAGSPMIRSRADIDHFGPKCADAIDSAGLPRLRTALHQDFGDASRATDLYQGASTIKRCKPPYLPHGRGASDPSCGAPLSNYSAPSGFAPGVRLLTINTTGIAGGGIVRAITRTTRPFDQIDEIGYTDPNVPCGHRPVARWVFGDANPGGKPLLGWLPTRDPALQPPRIGGECR